MNTLKVSVFLFILHVPLYSHCKLCVSFFSLQKLMLPEPLSVVLDFNQSRVLFAVPKRKSNGYPVVDRRPIFELPASARNERSVLSKTMAENRQNYEEFEHNNDVLWVDVTKSIYFSKRLFEIIGDELLNSDTASYEKGMACTNCHWLSSVLLGFADAGTLNSARMPKEIYERSAEDYLNSGYREVNSAIEAHIAILYAAYPTGKDSIWHSYIMIPGTNWAIQKKGFGRNAIVVEPVSKIVGFYNERRAGYSMPPLYFYERYFASPNL